MNENDIIDLLQGVISQPFLFSLLIIVTTFILEDLAITATALIASQNDMAIYIPLMALFSGIVIGDIGLYGIGKYSRRFNFCKKLIDHDKAQKAKKMIDRNLILAIFVSRFIPGMRLPTYAAIGVLNISFKKFILIVLIAVGLWSSSVFYLFYTLGDSADDMLGTLKWYGLGAAIILFILGPRLIKKLMTLRV